MVFAGQPAGRDSNENTELPHVFSRVRPGFRSARSFPVTSERLFIGAAGLSPGAEFCASARSAGDLVAGTHKNRVFNGVTLALRAAKGDEDAGKHETSSTGDLLSPVFFSHPNRVFDRAVYEWPFSTRC
jgi:hypothetical protein